MPYRIKILQVFKKAYIWYILCFNLLFIRREAAGLFVLQQSPDSQLYLQASHLLGNFITALSGIVVTLGYPSFLKIVSLVSPDFSLLPEIQFIIYGIAVFIFFIGLRVYGFTGLQALVTSCPLLFVQLIKEYASFMLTESLAVSLLILTIGLLLMAVSQPRKIFYWLGLLISLFLTYQVRPAFLFIIILIPFLGIILLIIRNKTWSWNNLYKSICIKLIAISIIPLLAFCTLRLAIVNHFGVVSFEGYNIVGIAISMLTEDIVPKLPSVQRPLATAILERRNLHKKLHEDRMTTGQASVNTPGTDIFIFPKYCTQPLPSPISSYPMWMQCYAYNIGQLSVPVVTENYGKKAKIVNDRLRNLSLAIIAQKPVTYIFWLYKAFRDGIYGIIQWEPLAPYLARILFISAIFSLAISIISVFKIERHLYDMYSRNTSLMIVYIAATLALIRLGIAYLPELFIQLFATYTIFSLFLFSCLSIISSLKNKNNSILKAFKSGLNEELITIVIVGISVYISGIVLVILVEPPIARYVKGLSVFIPSIFSLSMLITLSSVCHKIRQLWQFNHR